MPRLLERYRADIAPALIKEFSLQNVMQAPKMVKVVVNIGLGEALTNSKALDAAEGDLKLITGQRPVMTKAKKSIAAFKIREGMTIGIMVTLRGHRMYEFLDRLVNVALPRIRDFRGTPARSFDGRGNYSLGLREQVMFPEIDFNKVDRMRGLQLTFVTTAPNDEQARSLLTQLGFAFSREDVAA
ncbi:MAG: 50S ribosomal protein L5 [Chloroflexi bacterium]|nr:50S ribosomal protein L5 [Chloroflexota bacterium]